MGMNWFFSDKSRSRSFWLFSRSIPSSEDMVGSHRPPVCCDKSSPTFCIGDDERVDEYVSCSEDAGKESNGASEQSVRIKSSSTSDMTKPRWPRPHVSSGTHTSPAVGAKWVRSSGSSLSTAKAEIKMLQKKYGSMTILRWKYEI